MVNSFSKYFSMTGWRLGWVVVPDAPRRRVRAPAAEPLHLRSARVAGRRPRGTRRAELELDGHVTALSRQPRPCSSAASRQGHHRIADADGAFYVYADVSHLIASRHRLAVLCYRWLDELGVASTPGLDFDLGRGERFVRFSLRRRATTSRGVCATRGVAGCGSAETQPGPPLATCGCSTFDRARRSELRDATSPTSAPTSSRSSARTATAFATWRGATRATARACGGRSSIATSARSSSTSRTTADRDVLLALVDDANVLVENFRPGTLERLGLGARDAARTINAAAGDHRARHRLRPDRAVRDTGPASPPSPRRCRGSQR